MEWGDVAKEMGRSANVYNTQFYKLKTKEFQKKNERMI
jgi:hypothetical protein